MTMLFSSMLQERSKLSIHIEPGSFFQPSPQGCIAANHVKELFITWKTEQGRGYMNLHSSLGLEKIIRQKGGGREREAEKESKEEGGGFQFIY